MLLNEGVWIAQLLQEEKILFEAAFFISKLFVYFLRWDTLLVGFHITSGAFQCVPHKDIFSLDFKSMRDKSVYDDTHTLALRQLMSNCAVY